MFKWQCDTVYYIVVYTVIIGYICECCANVVVFEYFMFVYLFVYSSDEERVFNCARKCVFVLCLFVSCSSSTLHIIYVAAVSRNVVE